MRRAAEVVDGEGEDGDVRDAEFGTVAEYADDVEETDAVGVVGWEGEFSGVAAVPVEDEGDVAGEGGGGEDLEDEAAEEAVGEFSGGD